MQTGCLMNDEFINGMEQISLVQAAGGFSAGIAFLSASGFLVSAASSLDTKFSSGFLLVAPLCAASSSDLVAAFMVFTQGL